MKTQITIDPNSVIQLSAVSVNSNTGEYIWHVTDEAATTVCVPVTIGKKYDLIFSEIDTTLVGTIFRWGFTDTNTVSEQVLSRSVRSTPQREPYVQVIADQSYLVIQFGSAYITSILENEYFKMYLVDDILVPEEPNTLFETRRQMLLKEDGAKLIYELPTSTSASTYDTGIKLFDPPISFTILCQARWNHYNWSNGKALFGLGTGNTFRGFGRSTSTVYEYHYNVQVGSGARYCTTLRNTTASGTKCLSGYARGSNAAATRRCAVRYNNITTKIENFTSDSSLRHAPTHTWYLVGQNYTSATTLKLNISSAGATFYIFKIYEGLLDDQLINEFLDDPS